MGREVDVDHLVSARIIAERLGFKGVSLVHYYVRSDQNFPAPVFALPGPDRELRLWYWPEIEAWWAARKARRGGSSPPAEPGR